VAAVADASDASQCGDKKFVSHPSSRHVSFAFCHGVDLLGVDLRVPLSS
jgi:hypothetical protein